MSALVDDRAALARYVRHEGTNLAELGRNVVARGSSVSGLVSDRDLDVLREYLNELGFVVGRLVDALDAPVPANIEALVGA